MTRRMVRSLLFLAFLATPAVVVADAITFNFTGNVTFVDPLFSGTFNTTQSLSGSYTFESTLADGVPADPTEGEYGPLTALDFTIGGYTGTLPGAGSGIRVLDNFFGVEDHYSVGVLNPSAPSVAGLRLLFFAFGLDDFSQTAFGSDALPLSPPGLSSFGANRWFLSFGEGPIIVEHVRGQITSLTCPSCASRPVPEPGTLLLLGFGLLGMAGYGRKKLRRKPSAT